MPPSQDTQEQADREMSVFLDFLARSGLSVAPETVEKRQPPEPDIFCVHSTEGPIAFELLEICDESVAKTFNRRAPEPIFVQWLGGPDLGKITRKFSKPYPSSAPVELLCYTRARLATPDNVLVPTILHEVDFSANTRFQRIWYMGEHQVCILHDAR